MTIAQEIIDELIAQARRDAPLETCGYLLGVDGVVTENYPMENIDHSSEHFSFSPKEQFAALRYARRCGLKILANWHSHRLALTALSGGPATGQRPHDTLCHPFTLSGRAPQLLRHQG